MNAPWRLSSVGKGEISIHVTSDDSAIATNTNMKTPQTDGRANFAAAVSVGEKDVGG